MRFWMALRATDSQGKSDDDDVDDDVDDVDDVDDGS